MRTGKNKFFVFVTACLIVFMLSSCSTLVKNTDTSNKQTTITSDTSEILVNLPSQTADIIFLGCGNSDVVIYLNLTKARFLSFTLISSQPLNGNDIAVTLDTQSAYTTQLTELEQGKFPYHVFQCYQGVDWKELRELAYAAAQSDDDFSPEKETYRNAKNQYEDSYNNLTEDDIPILYSYNLELFFNVSKEGRSETINTLVLTVKGTPYTYDLGSILIDKDTPKIDNKGKQIVSNVLAYSDVSMEPSFYGDITMPTMELNVKENVTLKSLEFYKDETTVINNISMTITYADGMSVETKWDGNSPIELSKGDVVEMSITCRDPDMAKTLSGTVMKYPVLNYTCGGESYRWATEISLRMRQNAYEIYAVECDGVDILSYYLDYRNPVIMGNVFAEE